MRPPRQRILVAASDSGAGLAGMRTQAFELGSRVVRRLVARGFDVSVAIRADDHEFTDQARADGAATVPLPVGRTPLQRLAGFYGTLRAAGRSADLVYSLNPKLPFGTAGRCKTALTIHDFCYLEYPAEFDALRRRYHWLNQRYLLPRADVIFTVSADAAAKLPRHFPSVQTDRIVVAANGVSRGAQFDPVPDDPTRLAARLGIATPYFVFIGKLSPRKNLALVIRAVATLAARGLRPRIVMAGPPGWRQAADWALLDDAGVAHCFQSVGFLDPRDLALLLQTSAGLLYPSRCEGFGIPVLDALSAGIPVVVANGTVCAEIGGAFALGVDPDDVAGMAAIMERLLSDPPTRWDPALLAAHLARYDWDQSADIVAGALERLLHPHDISPSEPSPPR